MRTEKDDEVATEDCVSCSKYNVCNYTEPPIPMGAEHEAKPISAYILQRNRDRLER